MLNETIYEIVSCFLLVQYNIINTVSSLFLQSSISVCCCAGSFDECFGCRKRDKLRIQLIRAKKDELHLLAELALDYVLVAEKIICSMVLVYLGGRK